MSEADARNPPLDRHTFGWCAASVCAALLPLAPTLPGWLLGLLAALAAVGTLSGLRGRQLSAWIRLPLTLGVALVVLAAYDFKFGRDTGAALLVTMLALKLLETRRVRDARSVLSFALFAVMAGFLQDQSPATLLLAVVATVLALAALARVADVEAPSALAPQPVAARLRTVGKLLALSLPLAVVGFFLFPRLGSPLWGLPENSAKARTGLSDEMTPGDIAQLYLDDTPVMRVLFDGPTPPQHQLYWRGPVLSLFDGRAWTRAAYSSDNLPASRLEPLGPPVRYTVTQEPTDRRYLMTLDVPARAPDDARMGLDRMVSRRRAQTLLTSYEAVSYTRYRLEPDLLQTFRRSLQRLPEGFNPRTLELVRGWVAQGAAGEALVQRALDLFNREFTYTLNPVLLGRDSVDDFLFNTKAGYCEHFSAAFGVMMRAGGLPARIETGYQGGRANGVGNYWLVRQSDAHAWAEVWLPDRGWVRIDPTSAVAPERIERGTDSLAPESAWDEMTRPLFDAGDFVRRAWNEVVLGFDAARQRSLLGTLGVDNSRASQAALALGAGVGVALAVTLWLLLRRPPDRRDRLGQAYARFVARLARAGVGKAPHEGPLDFARRAARDLPDAAERVLALSDRYAHHRYARPEPGKDDAETLCADLRQFRVQSNVRNTTRSAP
jgi:transglutaminase-like putative cysteine protease